MSDIIKNGVSFMIKKFASAMVTRQNHAGRASGSSFVVTRNDYAVCTETLGPELVTNSSFDDVTSNEPDDWTKLSGTYDLTALGNGIIAGDGTGIKIRQLLDGGPYPYSSSSPKRFRVTIVEEENTFDYHMEVNTVIPVTWVGGTYDGSQRANNFIDAIDQVVTVDFILTHSTYSLERLQIEFNSTTSITDVSLKQVFCPS